MVLGEDQAQSVVQPVPGRGQATGTGLLRGRMTHGGHVPSIACGRSTATVFKEVARPATQADLASWATHATWCGSSSMKTCLPPWASRAARTTDIYGRAWSEGA